MDNDLNQLAINQALDGNWKAAIETNLKILQKNKDDTEALNRLARAYAELGNFPSARKTAKEVLKIDPFNTIATKALAKWKGLKKGDTYKLAPSRADTFLEEPGKTKITSLIHIGSPKILAKLDSGDKVHLNTHSHRAYITTLDGKYIGKLPDNLSARLKKFQALGNVYHVFIKSISKNNVKVFIREVKRGKKLANHPSFPTEKIEYISFTPPELVHRQEDLEIIPEEE